MKTNDRRIYKSSSVINGFPGFPERSGKPVTLVRPLTEDEADLDETGPMWRIKFDDGVTTDVFEDELCQIKGQ